MFTASLIGGGVTLVGVLLLLWRFEVAKHERDDARDKLSTALVSLSAANDRVSRLEKDISSMQTVLARQVQQLLAAVPGSVLPDFVDGLLSHPVDPSTGLPVDSPPSTNPRP